MNQTLPRRQVFKIAGLIAAGATIAGCRPKGVLTKGYPQAEGWPAAASETPWRLLNRITFGPRPAERQRLAEIGPEAFIEEQLAPDLLSEMAFRPRLSLRRLETLRLAAADLFDIEEPIAKQQLQQAALLRAVYSPRQLYEIMVDFWANHFNIDQNKKDCAWLKTVDDREVIRPHALGNFQDLLAASAHSPAMLFYLDNQENHAGNPNENYARELLELHTLGVDSGYTQTDIQELARCLTGWTIKAHFYRGHFTFDAEQHDDGPKKILGTPIPPGLKQAGGEKIIEMLANHSDTARFIATKLVRYFVADEPPPALVAPAAQTFLDTQGDIKAVLRTILLSPFFLSASSSPKVRLHRKLKRPLEFVVSALRQLNAKTDGGPPLLAHLRQMGQPLFQWPTPDGFPDRASAWTGSLLMRWRFALALVSNEMPGTDIALSSLLKTTEAQSREDRLNHFAILLLGQPLPNDVIKQLLQASDQDQTLLATLLSAPAFQWR